MKRLNIILCAVVATFYLSCQDKNDDSTPPPTPNIPVITTKTCVVNKEVVPEDTTTTQYVYNEAGKITVAKITDSKGLTFNGREYEYTGNQVVVTKKLEDGATLGTVKYTLGTNGHAERSISHWQVPGYEFLDTTFYTYNADSFLIKSTTKFYFGQNEPVKFVQLEEKTYTYSDGNLAKWEGNISIFYPSSYQSSRSETYEYYLDKINRGNNEIASWLGKKSKNLIKKMTYSYENSGTQVMETNYTYSFDDNGDINKQVSTVTTTTSSAPVTKTKNFFYSCK